MKKHVSHYRGYKGHPVIVYALLLLDLVSLDFIAISGLVYYDVWPNAFSFL